MEYFGLKSRTTMRHVFDIFKTITGVEKGKFSIILETSSEL